jgi:Family of unknown function (DUF6049)
MLAEHFRGVGRMKQFAAITASALIVAFAGLAMAQPASALAPSASLTVSAAPANSGDLRSGGTLRLFVTLTNGSELSSTAGTATISVGRTRFANRTTLAAWFAGTTKASLAPNVVAKTAVGALAPGASETVGVNVAATSLALGGVGVYPIAVIAKAGTETTAAARTAVAWNVTSTKPVPLVLAAPLTVAANTTPFISAKVLEQDTAPGGLLTRELDDLENSHVAIGIDPRILASIRILGKSVPVSAWNWLQQLEAVKNETFPLAWADADLTAPLQAGQSTVLTPLPLDYAINPSLFQAPSPSSTPSPTATPTPQDAQVPTSESLVAFNYTLPELAWPAANSVISADMPKLTASGLSNVILSSANVTEPKSTGLLGAAATVSQSSIAVSDSTLSGYLDTAVESPARSDSAAAATEFATTLALIGTESGSQPKITFATLGRNWANVDTNFDRTLSAIGSLSWSSAARLTDVFSATPTTVKVAASPQTAARITAVQAMIAAENGEAQFSVVAANPDALTSSRRLALLALLSDEWLDDSTTWSTEVTAYLNDTRDIVESVQVVASSTVTFLADSASLPITLSNNLDQDVTVYLAVTPTTPLVSIDKAHQFDEVTIEANSQKRVQIPIQSLSNGRAEVVATLYSSARRQVGHSQTIDVNVQAGWETFGTLVFAALIVAVFAIGIVRNIRKRRKIRRGEAVSDDDADDASAAASDDDAAKGAAEGDV